MSRGRKVVDWFCGTGEQKAIDFISESLFNVPFFLTTEPHTVSRGRKVVDWFCGTGEQKAPEMTPQQKYEQLLIMTDIKETKREKILLNLGAVGCMCLSVFFYAYFG